VAGDAVGALMPKHARLPATSWADMPRSLAFYAVFYLGSAVWLIGSWPLIRLWPGVLHPMVRNWGRYHRCCARWLLGIGLRIEGKVPNRACLVAMKHESFFEAIDLPVLFDHPAAFAKVELTRLPLWGGYSNLYGNVPVERDQGAKALRKMVAAARGIAAQGRPLVIFPEGTRVPHGAPAPLQSGFAGLYKLLGLPVVPVAVASGALYHRWWKRRGVIVLRFAEEIPAGLPREEVEARVRVAMNALNG